LSPFIHAANVLGRVWQELAALGQIVDGRSSTPTSRLVFFKTVVRVRADSGLRANYAEAALPINREIQTV